MDGEDFKECAKYDVLCDGESVEKVSAIMGVKELELDDTTQ